MARRAEFAAAASQFSPYLALELDGTLFFVSTESKYGRRLFASRRLKDGRQLDRSLRALQLAGIELPGTTLVDVGANIGTTTVQALREYGFSAALACEPDPENFRILRANLAVNGLDERVRAFNLAISNWTGSGALVLRGRGSQTHRLLRAGERAAETHPVPVTTLDQLAAEGKFRPDRVGLLWVDVEGFEAEVLEGAQSLVSQSVPIVVEFSAHRFRTFGGLDAFVDVLSPSYTHFYDLKPSFPSKRGFESLSAIEELLSRREDKTDLLVVRSGTQR